MTVSELIAQLRNFPANSQVVVYNRSDDIFYTVKGAMHCDDDVELELER